MIIITIFERCQKIAKLDTVVEDTATIPMCVTGIDRVTFPQKVINHENYEIKWCCKHVYYISDIHLMVNRQFHKKMII